MNSLEKKRKKKGKKKRDSTIILFANLEGDYTTLEYNLSSKRLNLNLNLNKKRKKKEKRKGKKGGWEGE